MRPNTTHLGPGEDKDHDEEWKEKVTKCLFHERKHTIIILHILKRYTVMFQTKELMLRRTADEQLLLMKEFCICFIQPNELTGKFVKHFIQLDLSEPSNIYKDVYVGSDVKKNSVRTLI